jgi:hypothetical protein
MLSFLSAWKNHETEDVTARARKQIASLSAYGGGESDGAAAATKTSRPLSLLGYPSTQHVPHSPIHPPTHTLATPTPPTPHGFVSK